jgi:hypothetical protein
MVGIIEKSARRSLFAVRRWSLAAGGWGGHDLADPIFDRYSHLFESSFEEVISGFDAH